MSRDLDALLRDWEFKPGMVQARLVRARSGREVIQVRVDLGMLQIETDGRPDGTRPHGFPTYFDYLRSQAAKADKAPPKPGSLVTARRRFMRAPNQEDAVRGPVAPVRRPRSRLSASTVRPPSTTMA